MTNQSPPAPPPKLPPGVRAFAIVFVWLAGSILVNTLQYLSDSLKRGPLAVPFLLQIATLFFLFGYLAKGFLKGERWAWWFTYTNATLALLLLPIYTLTIKPSESSNTLLLIMLSYWLIALLTYLGLRTSDVRTHFHITDLNFTRSCAMLVLLTSLQSAWWFAPEWVVSIYMKLNSPS